MFQMLHFPSGKYQQTMLLKIKGKAAVLLEDLNSPYDVFSRTFSQQYLNDITHLEVFLRFWNGRKEYFKGKQR